jgi:hypothetical protein
MTRTLALLFLLAACGSGRGGDQPAASDDRVECAVDGAAEFRRACEVERTSGAEGLVLTLRSPSGSFRRLLVTRDGRGVVAADGAEPAIVRVLGPDRIEVSIGSERYRLPATVR